MSLAQDMSDVGIEDRPFFVGDGFAKLFHMPAGRVIGQHSHKVGHLGMLLLGKVRVKTPFSITEHIAPATINLLAHVAHEIESVTPTLWACVWINAEGALSEADFETLVTE